MEKDVENRAVFKSKKKQEIPGLKGWPGRLPPLLVSKSEVALDGYFEEELNERTNPAQRNSQNPKGWLKRIALLLGLTVFFKEEREQQKRLAGKGQAITWPQYEKLPAPWKESAD